MTAGRETTVERQQHDALFTEADVYSGDPLRPDMETPTPPEVVACLTRPEREQRVRFLIEQAHTIFDDGWRLYGGKRTRAHVCILFSGGNDSTVLAHLFRHRATTAIHANTTIGIEKTRQFVRDTCAAWELPLVEEVAPQTFEELVLEVVEGEPRGFPGPGMHWFAYGRLKERALDQARHTLGFANRRKVGAMFVAGRRRQESERREDVPLHEVDGSVVWVSPLALWTKLDLTTYRLMHARTDPVPVNEVSELLHMSGECLCGAFAKPGELDQIGYWFPDVAAEIHAIEAKADAAGVLPPYNRWGHGQGAPSKSGRMCSSCPVPGQMTLGDAA